MNIQDSVKWFRNSAPYINAHRGRTFVLGFEGDALCHENFDNIVHDIALLNSLGVRLVLVHGARPQIDARLAKQGHSSNFHNNLRITDDVSLACVSEAVGAARLQIEALLTMGLINSPMHGAKIRVCSGNFVLAKPLGIIDGVDFCHTGEVRRIDSSGIKEQLDAGAIALLSSIGYSPTGEMFNLACNEVATRTAIALKADKLILFSKDKGIADEKGNLLRQCSLALAKQLSSNTEQQQLLDTAIAAIKAGIPRSHVISHAEDGALLQELFTREGCGTLVSEEGDYESLRTATIDDVGGILELIEPLEKNNTLVKRSRELLENEISQFIVIERDGMVIACAALYPFPEDRCAEIACVVSHPDYRGNNLGEKLLSALKKNASTLNINTLFVLTTRTAHWFMEQGFSAAPIESLPEKKQKLYNLQRNSKVFALTLA